MKPHKDKPNLILRHIHQLKWSAWLEFVRALLRFQILPVAPKIFFSLAPWD